MCIVKKDKISGFTIVRNIIKYDYPVVESIKSILPLVEEFVIGVGKSEDNTEKLIASIKSPKIKIIPRVWDDSIKINGEVLSAETNATLSEIQGEWGFYLQADEVIHEEDYEIIKQSIDKANKKNYDAISFKYVHFKGDYFSVNPWAYQREIRLIRNNQKIFSVGDACGFHEISKNKKPLTIKSKARIFHYGWVKTPKTMSLKQNSNELLYHGDEKHFTPPHTEKNIYNEVKLCRVYSETHPQTMKEKIAKFPPFHRPKSRWRYWGLYRKWLKYGWV